MVWGDWLTLWEKLMLLASIASWAFLGWMIFYNASQFMAFKLFSNSMTTTYFGGKFLLVSMVSQEVRREQR